MLWVILRWFFGWLWWLFLPIRKQLAIRNYKRCFPNGNSADLRHSVGDIITQYIYIPFGKRASLCLPKELDQGGICLAGHGSAWDIALLSLAETVPVTIFLRQPSNPFAAKLIDFFRRRSTVEGLYGRDNMPRAYQALKEGRLVIFVQDQRHNHGIDSLFFGRPCLTSAAFASMLHRSQAPLFGAWQVNDGSNISLTIQQLHWDIPQQREQALRTLTQQSQDFYQEKISAHPHSWLWLHDRWKYPNNG